MQRNKKTWPTYWTKNIQTNRKQLIETVPKEAQILDLVDKDFKSVV